MKTCFQLLARYLQRIGVVAMQADLSISSIIDKLIDQHEQRTGDQASYKTLHQLRVVTAFERAMTNPETMRKVLAA